MSLNDTPRADRLHIGIFGKRNSGKSSLINALTGQDIALVSDTPGTTTDPVFKSMELHPIGPVVFIDTAGFDDEGRLGELRVQRTEDVMSKTDVAVVVIDGRRLPSRTASMPGCASDDISGVTGEMDTAECATKPFAVVDEVKWIKALEEKNIPVIIAVNKCDALVGCDKSIDGDTLVGCGEPTDGDTLDGRQGHGAIGTAELSAAGSEPWARVQTLLCACGAGGKHPVIAVSAAKGTGLSSLREAIEQVVPEDFLRQRILAGMIEDGSLALLVMPQDIQAPKGRLILPQVQTLRELLDKKCTAVSTTADGLERTLATLNRAPDLIITDSQCFDLVYRMKPAESELTSFSVLFAAYKGDIGAFAKGVSALDDMTEKSKVLIAEACTHVPLAEDIGREKIPKLLHKKFGEGMEVVNVCGNGFPKPEALKDFDLVIHCGACMFNRKHVLNRIAATEEAGVPITNYGIALAKLAGILDKVKLPK